MPKCNFNRTKPFKQKRTVVNTNRHYSFSILNIFTSSQKSMFFCESDKGIQLACDSKMFSFSFFSEYGKRSFVWQKTNSRVSAKFEQGQLR